MLVIGTTEGVFVAETGERARGTNLAQRDVKVLRQANGRLLAGATDGVYRSADGGSTWQHVGLQDREVLEVAPAPQDPQLVYVGTRPAALFRSRDGGDTWTEVESFTQAFDAGSWGLPPIANWPPGARAHSIVVDAANAERCMVGIEVGGIASTNDGGASWTTTLPGGDPDIHCIVADPLDPQTLYASTGFGRIGRLAEQPNEERVAGMFGSDDGGRSWRYLWSSMGRRVHPPAVHRHAAAVCHHRGYRPQRGAVHHVPHAGWREGPALPEHRSRHYLARDGRRRPHTVGRRAAVRHARAGPVPAMSWSAPIRARSGTWRRTATQIGGRC